MLQAAIVVARMVHTIMATIRAMELVIREPMATVIPLHIIETTTTTPSIKMGHVAINRRTTIKAEVAVAAVVLLAVMVQM